MKILVTGGHGQLGGELARLLGAEAVAMDVDQLDLTQVGIVRATLREIGPDAVINCAAYTHVDNAEAEAGRCRKINALAVEHLAGVCAELDCPLVQISTDYVFGDTPDRREPRNEEQSPSPRGVYAQTKLEGERAAARHEKHLIVRTCGLYARPTDERARNFVKTILLLGHRGRQLKVVDDQHCTPSYVPHVAAAVAFLAKAAVAGETPWGTYHVTNQGATTWHDFAVEILRRAGIEAAIVPISTAEYGAAAPRPEYSVLDTAKYHGLGGPAMPDWKEALGQFFAEWALARRRNGG